MSTKEVSRETSKEPSSKESSKEPSKEPPSKEPSTEPSPDLPQGARWNLTPEEREIYLQYTRRGLFLTAFATAFLSFFVYLVIDDILTFSGPMKAQDLSDFASRLKFLFRFQTLNLFWLMFCMYWVISKRMGTPAVERVIEYDHLTALAQRHFTNTIEQYLMSLLSQLILITYLDASNIIRYIPAINVLFFIGRFTFWIGYPKHRTFGFMINNFALLATVAYNLYKFGQLYKIF